MKITVSADKKEARMKCARYPETQKQIHHGYTERKQLKFINKKTIYAREYIMQRNGFGKWEFNWHNDTQQKEAVAA